MYLFPNNNFFNLRPHNIVVESQSEQRSEEGGGGGGRDVYCRSQLAVGTRNDFYLEVADKIPQPHTQALSSPERKTLVGIWSRGTLILTNKVNVWLCVCFNENIILH